MLSIAMNLDAETLIIKYICLKSQEVTVKAQCLWDVAIKMNSSIDSTNVLAANLKPLYWVRCSHFASIALLTFIMFFLGAYACSMNYNMFYLWSMMNSNFTCALSAPPILIVSQSALKITALFVNPILATVTAY